MTGPTNRDILECAIGERQREMLVALLLHGRLPFEYKYVPYMPFPDTEVLMPDGARLSLGSTFSHSFRKRLQRLGVFMRTSADPDTVRLDISGRNP